MKKIIIFYVLLMSFAYAKTEIDKAFIVRGKGPTGKFTLHSPDVIEGRQIGELQVYDDFGCSGKNMPPRLAWKNAPKGTQSFAITMFNKDANTGSGWWHWIVYDVPTNIYNLDFSTANKKAVPKSVRHAMNDYGKKAFGGVCPPAGARHNYIITIHALDVPELKIPRSATPAMASLYIHEHSIGTATIKAFYRREGEIMQRGNNLGVVSLDGGKKYKLNNGGSSTNKNNIKKK